MGYSNLSTEEVAKIKASLHKQIDNLGDHLFYEHTNYNLFHMMKLLKAAKELKFINGATIIECLNNAISDVCRLSDDEDDDDLKYGVEYTTSQVRELTYISTFVAKACDCV